MTFAQRWAAAVTGPGADRIFLVFEGQDGSVTQWTYREFDAAVARIEYQLLGSGEREVRSERLGELVMNELRELDTIAYVRFASVYRRFEDVSEFEDVIEEFRRAATPPKPPRKR